ncbi:hypothetical protein V2J09_020446 [Rumex salicifolius]
MVASLATGLQFGWASLNDSPTRNRLLLRPLHLPLWRVRRRRLWLLIIMDNGSNLNRRTGWAGKYMEYVLRQQDPAVGKMDWWGQETLGDCQHAWRWHLR